MSHLVPLCKGTHNFDKNEVQSEIDTSVRVTQAFDATRQSVKQEINKEIDEANKNKKSAEEKAKNPNLTYEETENLQADIKKANEKIEEMQKVGLLVDMVNGALYNPSDTLAGTAVNTLSPALVYKVGQYFKENEKLNKLDGGDRDEQGSTKHLLAQALVAGVTAGLAGNDILSSTISGGGGEAIAPYLAEYIYGVNPKDVSKMTAEQKQTISAIISLAGTAIGATSGSVTDMVASGVAGTVAVEENRNNWVDNTLSFYQKPVQKRTPKEIKQATSFIADFIPIYGDIKGLLEAKDNTDTFFAMAAIIPIVGDGAKKIYDATKAYENAEKIGDVKGMVKAINDVKYEVSKYKTPSGKTYDFYGQKIDMDLKFKTPSGKMTTNREWMAKGNNPYVLDKNGNPVSTQHHHVDQDSKGPIVEVPTTVHQDRGKQNILHPYGNNKNPQNPVDHKEWSKDRKDINKQRAKQ